LAAIGCEGQYGARFPPGPGFVYDNSGGVRQGPAPFDIAAPESAVLTYAKLKIG
jgi:ubiquinol-cytochrome c reductase iron-sulfur subunit